VDAIAVARVCPLDERCVFWWRRWRRKESMRSCGERFGISRKTPVPVTRAAYLAGGLGGNCPAHRERRKFDSRQGGGYKLCAQGGGASWGGRAQCRAGAPKKAAPRSLNRNRAPEQGWPGRKPRSELLMSPPGGLVPAAAKQRRPPEPRAPSPVAHGGDGQ